jgi:hypothetical protein
MSNPSFVKNVVAIAITTQLVKKAVAKLGYEHIAPLDPAIQDEKISKAINQKLRQLPQ